jgi:hypothetical protein
VTREGRRVVAALGEKRERLKKIPREQFGGFDWMLDGRAGDKEAASSSIPTLLWGSGEGTGAVTHGWR